MKGGPPLHQDLSGRPAPAQGDLAFGELERPAIAQLGMALGRRLPELDPALPCPIFADHGFRLDPAGRAFTHGSDSALERLVPVWKLAPAG